MSRRDLEELFPEGRHHGRVGRIKQLSSWQKAMGVAYRKPEVMFRFGKANIKSYYHIVKAADYIARNGKIELCDENGEVFEHKLDYRKALYQWKLEKGISEDEGKFGYARRVILSMPAGTDEEKFQEACKNWAKENLADYRYLMAFHFAGNDKKTRQPHCHILFCTLNRENKRMHVSNEELQTMREHFASCLMEQGIEANATTRKSRGKTLRPLNQAEIHTAKERARSYAIAKKKKLLRTQQSHIQTVSEAFMNREQIPDHPGIKKAKENRQKIIDLAQGAAEYISKTDPVAANNLRQYYGGLEPVESRDQVALRSLKEEKSKQVRRWQAMKARLKKSKNKEV